MLKFFYPSIDMGWFNVEIVISWSRYALMKKFQKNPQPKTGDLFHFISKLAVPVNNFKKRSGINKIGTTFKDP